MLSGSRTGRQVPVVAGRRIPPSGAVAQTQIYRAPVRADLQDFPDDSPRDTYRARFLTRIIMVLPSNDADDMNDIRQVFSHTSEHHYPSQRVPGPLTKSDALENVESAQDEDAVYEKFSETQKRVMTAIVAYCSLCAPFSTTCIFSATPEIASDFHTTGTIINVTNAVYLVMMAISPLYWGPMSQIYGRKPIYIASSFGYFIGSLGTSVSVNLAMFIVFRCITAFAGTSFLAVGAGTIGDIYKPVHRGSAMGLYLAGKASCTVMLGLFVDWLRCHHRACIRTSRQWYAPESHRVVSIFLLIGKDLLWHTDLGKMYFG